MKEEKTITREEVDELSSKYVTIPDTNITTVLSLLNWRLIAKAGKYDNGEVRPYFVADVLGQDGKTFQNPKLLERTGIRFIKKIDDALKLYEGSEVVEVEITRKNTGYETDYKVKVLGQEALHVEAKEGEGKISPSTSASNFSTPDV
tara:strand:- start:540 stop:980 length:441 start_codon:yes stop_codon:yes gene_type:complete